MIERVGNRLPHPVVLFIMLAVGIIAISGVAARMGVTVNYTDTTGENVVVEAVSLMTGEGLAYIFNTAVSNFTGFAPLGTVLVAMLGVGVAEWSGLIGTSLKDSYKMYPIVC